MAEEKKAPTLKELIAETSGELKPKEDILKTIQHCAKKGVSIDIKSHDDVYVFDDIDFSIEELKRAYQYAENGAAICIRKNRPEASKRAYNSLSQYFNNRIAENLSQKK